jgi:ATP-binding cassette subfamily B multidrug efflux pump
MYGPFEEYLRPYKKRLLTGLLAALAAAGAAALIPLLIERAVNAVYFFSEGDQQTQLFDQIELCALGMVGLGALAAVGRYFMRWLLGSSSNSIEYDIRAAYFTHLLRQPLAYYQSHRTGDLMARATNDLNSVHIFFTYCLRSLAEAALTIAFSLTMMCLINWQLALIVLIPLPLLGFTIVRMGALVQNRFRSIQELFGRMSNFIQENISGIRVVKAYVQGPAQIAAFDELNQDYLNKNHGLIHIHAVYYPLFYLMSSIGLSLVLWFGGEDVISGQLNIGGFVAFNTYLTMLIRPISFMGWLIDRTQRALVAMRRINEVMDVEPEIRNQLAPAQYHSLISGHIQFRGLDFSYGDSQILHHIDLDIPAGTTLGIVGRVGSGKTTLARLIPRLIQTAPDQLFIDGKSIDEWPLEQLRSAIGYVSQNPFLFSDTIAANIAYGVDEATTAQISEAAEEAQIRRDIEEFDNDFATVIGERGVTLSGGQKQRSTLARALIRQPAILILDDALSAVDTHTEEAILTHLRRIMRQRTTILIAHRISTLRDADRIVVLDEGRIVEQGTHEELVRHGRFYAELFRRQQLNAELEAL